jgi:hypothetical protein
MKHSFTSIIYYLYQYTYWERKLGRKTVSGIMLMLLLTSVLTLAFEIKPVKATTGLLPILDTFTIVMEPNTTGWFQGISYPFVFYDNGLYKMWFRVPGQWIGYAESNDGVAWFNEQPVHDCSSEWWYRTGGPSVIKEGEIYRMWHWDYPEDVAGDWSSYIAHMISTDGISWPAFMSAEDLKVMSAQGQSNPQGDGYCVFAPCVLYETGIDYVMWYSVVDHPRTGMGGPHKIWRATSGDGIAWSNRTLTLPYVPTTWEGNVEDASVVKEDDGTYTMFYEAVNDDWTDFSVGIAGSIDGITWANRTQILKSSDLGVNIASIETPFHFQDPTDGKRYLYFSYYDKGDGRLKLGRVQLGPAYVLTITATAGGTTNPTPGTHNYPALTLLSVTAIPGANYLFDHWELDGVNSTENPINVTMDQDHTLHAVFMGHDVAVTDVTPSKTVVGQGFNATINVTVANQGDYTETFNVTTYVTTPPLPLEIVIDITTVSLDAGGNMKISLAWNTTGLDIGNFTFTATAESVAGETNTADNTFSVVVTVTIPGDINGDFQVSLSDLVLLANAYGSTPQMPSKWNPNADINGDGKVSLSDLVLMANHYGQHYP